MKTEEKINDLLNINNLKIVQNTNYFSFSLDSILLSNFVLLNYNTKNILDLCTGNAPIPLVLSTKTDSKIYAVELQKEIYDLAKKSIEINHLENQIILINDDVKNITNKFKTDTFDLITCNPPYFKYKDTSIENDNKIKSIARHEICISLEDIIKISKKLLKNGASLCIVHRPDRLIENNELMKSNNLEPKRLQFIYPKKNSDANLILIEARKNGKEELKILKPLYVHNDDGTYTDEILKMFGE